MYSAKLVDLPCVIEAQKTLDNKRMFKVADICQVCLSILFMIASFHTHSDASCRTKSFQRGGSGHTKELQHRRFHLAPRNHSTPPSYQEETLQETGE